MLDQLMQVWRARHVLLVGGTDVLCACFQALLTELGARPARIPPSASSETLCRSMTSGRISAVIVPRAHALTPEKDAARQLFASDALLTEVREAGIPLLILCSDAPVYRAQPRPWLAEEDDALGGQTREGLLQSLVQLYAEGAARGLLGDPVNALIVRHPPLLGTDAPAVAQYTRWCHSLLAGDVVTVEQPDRQGVFAHPLDTACGALALGARSLAGDLGQTRVFNLATGPEGLTSNRGAALRFIRRAGGTRPIAEREPPAPDTPPLLCGARARLLGGIRPLLGADEALSLLLSLERARAAGTADAEMQRQAHDYLLRLP